MHRAGFTGGMNWSNSQSNQYIRPDHSPRVIARGSKRNGLNESIFSDGGTEGLPGAIRRPGGIPREHLAGVTIAPCDGDRAISLVIELEECSGAAVEGSEVLVRRLDCTVLNSNHALLPAWTVVSRRVVRAFVEANRLTAARKRSGCDIFLAETGPFGSFAAPLTDGAI